MIRNEMLYYMKAMPYRTIYLNGVANNLIVDFL